MNWHGELVEFPRPQPRCVLIVGLPNDGYGIVGSDIVARGMKPNDLGKYTHWFNCFYLNIIELAMYVSHVLDRKLLERLMSPSPKSQVMFASAFS